MSIKKCTPNTHISFIYNYIYYLDSGTRSTRLTFIPPSIQALKLLGHLRCKLFSSTHSTFLWTFNFYTRKFYYWAKTKRGPLTSFPEIKYLN